MFRRARLVVLLLLVGAFTSIVVALFAQWHSQKYRPELTTEVHYTLSRDGHWHHVMKRPLVEYIRFEPIEAGTLIGFPETEPPTWVRKCIDEHPGSKPLDVIGYGWPMVCACYSSRMQVTREPIRVVMDNHGVVDFPWIKVDGNPLDVATKVSWFGLAVNTVLFSAFWGGAVTSCFLARRWWRARKRQCLRCGYSRDGLATSTPCPECSFTPKAA